jgi:hypothetical protein
MKIFRWLLPLLVVVFLASLFTVWNMFGWLLISVDNPEPGDSNLAFVGKDPRFYNYSMACQNADGTLAIASALSDRKSTRDAVSIIRLAADGSFAGEHVFTFARPSFWSVVPWFLRGGKGHQYLRIVGLEANQNGYYLLLTRQKGAKQEPFILELNDSGKLTKQTPIPLHIEAGAQMTALLQDGYTYLVFLNGSEKLLNLAKIDLANAEVVMNPMLFYKQRNLRINSVAANPADTTISITAYDDEKGCSFYQYTPATDLKEYFRTAPGSEFTVLKHIGDRLISVIREDSLLEVMDLIIFDKPVIAVLDTLPGIDFRATDITELDGDFYVSLDFSLQNAEKNTQNIQVRKYAKDGSKSLPYLIQGSDYETAKGIFPTSDGHLIVIGNSSSRQADKGPRVFTSKFRM